MGMSSSSRFGSNQTRKSLPRAILRVVPVLLFARRAHASCDPLHRETAASKGRASSPKRIQELLLGNPPLHPLDDDVLAQTWFVSKGTCLL
ncbi:hypothetical protein BJV74DRAFT_818814, partial [Russula compacta]